jgi:hypothetical protein
LTVTYSTISGNSAISGSGGGIHGGYSYFGNFTVTGSTAGDIPAGYSGGYSGGYMTVTGSTISGNSASDRGGGIYNSYGNLTVTSSTIAAIGRHGGGI